MPKSTSTVKTFLALATALATPAYAQDAPAVDEGGIRDIIVTAQRRSENIQSVPVYSSGEYRFSQLRRGVTCQSI